MQWGGITPFRGQEPNVLRPARSAKSSKAFTTARTTHAFWPRTLMDGSCRNSPASVSASTVR